jgi:hypothetical protein
MHARYQAAPCEQAMPALHIFARVWRMKRASIGCVACCRCPTFCQDRPVSMHPPLPLLAVPVTEGCREHASRLLDGRSGCGCAAKTAKSSSLPDPFPHVGAESCASVSVPMARLSRKAGTYALAGATTTLQVAAQDGASEAQCGGADDISRGGQEVSGVADIGMGEMRAEHTSLMPCRWCVRKHAALAGTPGGSRPGSETLRKGHRHWRQPHVRGLGRRRHS